MPLDQWLNRHGPEAPGYPTAAADHLLALRPRRIVNEFTWGGYLGWRAGGRFQVLLDGRTQCFTPDFWQTACLNPHLDRRRWLESLRADAAVLSVHDRLYQPLLRDLGWRQVYADDRAQVLVPASGVSADAR
jgi:hypothetical protein